MRWKSRLLHKILLNPFRNTNRRKWETKILQLLFKKREGGELEKRLVSYITVRANTNEFTQAEEVF